MSLQKVSLPAMEVHVLVLIPVYNGTAMLRRVSPLYGFKLFLLVVFFDILYILYVLFFISSLKVWLKGALIRKQNKIDIQEKLWMIMQEYLKTVWKIIIIVKNYVYIF